MQTFLPYSDFHMSANVLDKKRQFKQVVEAKQILCILRADNLPLSWQESKSYIKQPWVNHPAVKMWEHHTELLKQYYNIFLQVARNKHNIKTSMPVLEAEFVHERPWWLGVEDFHRAIRSRLIVKDFEFYSNLFPRDNGFNDGKYLWPEAEKNKFRII